MRVDPDWSALVQRYYGKKYGSQTTPLMATNFSPLYRYTGGQPIAHDVLAEIETSAYLFPQAIVPQQYVTPSTKSPMSDNRFTFPAADAERLFWWDTGARCIAIEPDVITPTALAFELSRTQLNKKGIGVLETVATFFDVEALDAQGVPIFEFSTFPADADPCPLPLVHPDPVVQDLQITFRIVAQQVPTFFSGRRTFPFLTAVIPQLVQSSSLVLSPWADNRYGWGTRYSMRQQFLIGGRVLLRMFAFVSGQPNRWRIRQLTGRLQGYWHAGGQKGAALHSAIHRVN